jgi:hypothetical protein
MGTNLLDIGAKFLADQNIAHMSRQVTYKRGNQSVVIAAKPGRTPLEDVQADDTIIRSESRDFIVRGADLVLAGVPVTPADGDQIIEVDASSGTPITYTHDVMPDGGMAPFAHQNDYRYELRIRTKRTS